MAIEKTIYQTFKSSKLPLLTRYHIYKLKRRNPEYKYEFYDDQRIEDFLKNEFDQDIYSAYKRINIGAAKADVFRLAVLYKYGGVYLDIDSLILNKIDDFLEDDDSALISLEGNLNFYIQYALFYKAGHPFLKKALEMVVDNIKTNRFHNDVHKMTGPATYTAAIKACLEEDPNIPYREIGLNYENMVKFSYRGSKTFLYGISKKKHWKRMIKTHDVLTK